MSKGAKGGGVTTVKNEPAAFVAPYLTQAANESADLYNNYRPEYFPGSSYVPFSPETELALQAQTQRAIGGSPVTGAAQDQLTQTLQGNFLNGNQYLQPALQAEYDRIAGGINSQFATGGGYGGSANQEVLAREQMKAANQALSQNYQNERGLQMSAVNQAPALASADYADIEALRGVGMAREDLFGRQLQDQLDQYQYEISQDPQALDDYISRLSQLSNGYSTQTQTAPKVKTSPLSTIGQLGGAALSIYGGNPLAALGLTGGLDPRTGITWNSGRIG